MAHAETEKLNQIVISAALSNAVYVLWPIMAFSK